MVYDYVILGGGASGLSLAHRMIKHPYFDDKKIALLEQEKKEHNDRTWCFWQAGNGTYDQIVHKSWAHLEYHSPTLDKVLDIAPYVYKMIRGIDFYKLVYGDLERASNIDIVYDKITTVVESDSQVKISGSSDIYLGKHVFKSFLDPEIDKEKHRYVDQHFKGFFIETEDSVFDASRAIMMDFRIDQQGETRFLYVLPESDRRALVEVAIFSNDILSQEDYDEILTSYISEYITKNKYEILETEFGIIPMTTYPFYNHNTELVTHIGTGGGVVKPSSGYAFRRIQEHSDQLINCIVDGKPMSESYKSLLGRFTLYDKTMMHAMLKGGVSGDRIFTDLFGKKKASLILKFLDQKTTFTEELSIFTAPPFFPFIKGFVKELF